MLSIIILIIAFISDGVLSNFLPYLPNDLSLFTPLLTLTSLLLIYPLYRKEKLKYYAISIIFGFLYDLFYTNLLFFNAIIFFICGIFISFLYKNIGYSFFKIILLTTILIITYESLTALIILLYNLVPITFSKLFYKITHSLLLNIIFALLCYSIIELIPKKYKNISIN